MGHEQKCGSHSDNNFSEVECMNKIINQVKTPESCIKMNC